MGINTTTLTKFKQFYDEGIFKDVTAIMELGSQEVWCEEQEESVKSLFQHFGIQDVRDEEISRIARRGSAREMYEKLGFTYNCIDVDGQFGALVLDLNFENVPELHRNGYDFVTNFGTTEHVANQLNCFKVMHELTKPGGYMYHELICSGELNHGLVNYNPKMFWLLCKSNFYEYIGMWFNADIENPEKLPENIIQMSRNLETRVIEGFATQAAGICVLARKAFDLPFVPPLDGDLSATTETQKSRYWTLVSYPDVYNKISHLKYQVITPKQENFNDTQDNPTYQIVIPSLEKLNDTQEKLTQTQEELEQIQAQLQQVKIELEQTQGQLEQTNVKVQQSHIELQQSRTESQQFKDELQQSQSKLQQSEGELQQKQIALQQNQTQLQQSQMEAEQLKGQLNLANAEIEAMKSSKFWKLREQWFKLKKLLGFPVDI